MGSARRTTSRVARVATMKGSVSTGNPSGISRPSGALSRLAVRAAKAAAPWLRRVGAWKMPPMARALKTPL